MPGKKYALYTCDTKSGTLIEDWFLVGCPGKEKIDISKSGPCSSRPELCICRQSTRASGHVSEETSVLCSRGISLALQKEENMEQSMGQVGYKEIRPCYVLTLYHEDHSLISFQ